MKPLCRIIPVLLLALLATATLCAQSRSTRAQERKKDALEKEIRILDGQLKANAKAQKNALAQMDLLRKKISLRKGLLEESERDIRDLDSRISVSRRELHALQTRLDTLTAYYVRLVRGAYKNRDARAWYMYVLGSENIGQAWRRFSYLKGLSANMNAQALKIKDLQAQVQERTDSLSSMRAEASKLRSEHARELGALKSDETQSQRNIDELGRNRARYLAELKQKQKQVDALRAEIARIIRNTGTGKGGKKSGKPASPEDAKLQAEFVANKGKLPWPVEGTIVDRFGRHAHPVYTNVQINNNGISMATAPGATVHAVFNGKVRQIGVMMGYNKCILVQHGNCFSLYGGMATTRVKAGDKVTTGQVLGTVDTIAGETRFHFQLWQDGSPRDPEPWLR